jgi:hypothetical protein
MLARGNGDIPGLPPDYVIRATCVSFAMDGLALSEDEARAALSPNESMLRSRLAQRVRNHAAILHHIENDLRSGAVLTVGDVVRWYTTISSGLSTAALDAATATRLDEQVRRMNSPQLRLQAALTEAAENHVRLLNDPIVPSFNGIMARLLLRYHLGRCKLPPVIFDASLDGRMGDTDAMIRRLVHLLEASYDELIAAKGE